MEDTRVVVVGGGLVGVLVASLLRRASFDVVLVDQRRVGSGREGEVMGYSYIEPWGGSRFGLGGGAILRPSFWLWGLRYLYSWLFDDLQKKSDVLHQFARRNYAVRTGLIDQLDLKSCVYETEGLLRVYSGLRQFLDAEEKVRHYKEKYNEKMSVYRTRTQCAAVDKEVSKFKMNIVGCIKNDNEKALSCDTERMTERILEISEQAGVKVLRDSEVNGFNVIGDRVNEVTLTDGEIIEGDIFVVCAEIESKALGKTLGWTVPLWSMKNYTLDAHSATQLTNNILLHSSTQLYITKRNNSYRIYSRPIITGLDDNRIEETQRESIKEQLIHSTGFSDMTFDNEWTGLSPVSADGIPIIGKFPKLANVYLSAGHVGLAFSSAELVTHIILGKSPLIDPAPFDPSRFFF